MKKNYKYELLDFLKNYRDTLDDEFLLRSVEERIDLILLYVNPLDYLIYEGNK